MSAGTFLTPGTAVAGMKVQALFTDGHFYNGRIVRKSGKGAATKLHAAG